MNVYASTSCLANGSDMFDVFNSYSKAGIKNVELGTKHQYVDNLSLDKLKQYDLNLLVHHYFPPPRDPFIVNLASQDTEILTRSREQIKKSLDFCQSFGIGLFTFHGGFRADPDDKLRFSRRSITPQEIAFSTFVESVREINDYAGEKGIRIAVENNVLSDYNVIDGKNMLLLFCEADDFNRLWESIPSANLGILLDLGHLKVTSHWLGFDRYEFIDGVKDRVYAIHVHENNGQRDVHKELNETSWCLEVITRKYFTNLPIVLESHGMTIERIVQQVSLIDSASKKKSRVT